MIKEFKIREGHNQKYIQHKLFNLGYSWGDGSKKYRATDSIFFKKHSDSKLYIAYPRDEYHFQNEDLPEITFKEFKEMIGDSVVKIEVPESSLVLTFNNTPEENEVIFKKWIQKYYYSKSN